MINLRAISLSLVLGFAACGPAAAPNPAEAQAAAAPLSAADQAAILQSQSMSADARGLVENECGERVAPQFIDIDLGGAAGSATLFVMTGGPNSAACYGDGPGLTLLKREGSNWRNIYSSRSAYLAVLNSRTSGVRDLAQAGAGFQHPLWTWNGAEYAPAGRGIGDQQMADATILP